MIDAGSVTLRPVRRDDLDALYRLIADLDTWELRRGDPPMPVTRAAFESWYLARVDTEPDRKHGAEFVIEHDGELVGRCGLFSVDELARHAQVGIGLLPEHTGQGYGTDALRALVEFGFRRWNLHRIGLGVLARNERAIASYRKIGFVEEGRLRQAAWVHGEYTDEVLMGLLRPDWVTAARTS